MDGRCAGCGAGTSRWNAIPPCPACHAATGAPLPLPPASRAAAALWPWTTEPAQAGLATGDLAAILRAYRAATGITQRQLAELLGYDRTYISMIETRHREITDVAARRRIARHLGVPPIVVDAADPDDADVAAMLQFGESTVRLASLARLAGHGAEAVNELWSVVECLEDRVVNRRADRKTLLLLSRARAELGVSLGYVLPEELLPRAAQWTGRALRLAEHLDDPQLLGLALRVHGNELRKAGRAAAAVTRLRRAVELMSSGDRAMAFMQLARAAADAGDRGLFDRAVGEAIRLVDVDPATPALMLLAVYEVQLRGLTRTGRVRRAAALLAQRPALGTAVPPQWQAILAVTLGEVLAAEADNVGAAAAFRTAVSVSRCYRLPHQIQRVIRATEGKHNDINEFGRAALEQLVPGRVGLSNRDGA